MRSGYACAWRRRSGTGPVGNSISIVAIVRQVNLFLFDRTDEPLCVASLPGEQPPREFLRAAEEEIRLRQWLQQREKAGRRGVLDDHDQLESEASLQDPEEDDLSEARRFWTQSLEELRLQMPRSKFDTWLRGSQVI